MRKLSAERQEHSGSVVLSVVIPAYNSQGDIERAVRSVLGQMTESVELLVVDDGSTDRTPEKLAELDAGVCSAVWLRQPNGGPASARNLGMRRSRGTWILFLDADDALEAGALAAILRYLDKHPRLDLLLGDHLVIHPDGLERRIAAGVLSADPNRRLADYLLYKRISICHGAAVFRRERVLQRPYPEQFEVGEDIPVFAFMLASPTVASIPNIFARIHRQAGSRRTKQVDRQHDAFLDETFRELIAAPARLRSRFKAQRLLSEFRSCYRVGDRARALNLYSQALAISPAQALRWTYLAKRLKLASRALGKV